MMTVDLNDMMREQAELQLALGDGSHPATWAPPEQMAYIREMAVAATSELHEALGATGWKTWASSNHVDRDEFVAELVDMLQFWMNLLMVVDASAEEVRNKLAAKHDVNWRRLHDGYDGRNKCPGCKRALDDAATKCTPTRCYGESTSVELVER